MDASAMKSDTPQYVESMPDVRPDSNGSGNGILAEDAFHQMIYLEKKRTERSGKPFLLLLINLKNFRSFAERIKVFKSLGLMLSSALRETDVRGWFEYDFIMGVIFTEIGETDINRARNRIHQKLRDSLLQHLDLEQINMLDLSFQVYTGRREEQVVECTLNVQPIEEDSEARDGEIRPPRSSQHDPRQRCFLFVGDVFLITLAHFLSVLDSTGPVPKCSGGLHGGLHFFHPALSCGSLRFRSLQHGAADLLAVGRVSFGLARDVHDRAFGHVVLSGARI